MNKNFEEFYYKKAREKGGWKKGFRAEALRFILERFKPGNSLLEIGCGTGEVIDYLPKTLKFVGVEASLFAIEEATKRFGNLKNVEFLHLKKSNVIPFPNGLFDFVMSIFVLEHLQNPKEMLNEMVRVLKNKGYLILMAPNLEMPLSFHNAVRHKNIVYKFSLTLLRIKDYFSRLLGVYNFRIIKDNFTQVTGRYEKLDDDLTYVVSSFEVIEYLKKQHKLQPILINKFRAGDSWRDKIKRIITMLPTMEYYGTILFIVMRKI